MWWPKIGNQKLTTKMRQLKPMVTKICDDQNYVAIKNLATKRHFNHHMVYDNQNSSAYFEQPKMAFALSWPYIDMTQRCIYIQMHLLCYDRCTNVMTSLFWTFRSMSTKTLFTSFFHSHKIYMHTASTTTLVHQNLIWKCLGIEIWKFTWVNGLTLDWLSLHQVWFELVCNWPIWIWFKFGLVKIRDLIQISFKQSKY